MKDGLSQSDIGEHLVILQSRKKVPFHQSGPDNTGFLQRYFWAPLVSVGGKRKCKVGKWGPRSYMLNRDLTRPRRLEGPGSRRPSPTYHFSK